MSDEIARLVDWQLAGRPTQTLKCPHCRAKYTPPGPCPECAVCHDCDAPLTWNSRHQIVNPLGQLIYVCPRHYQQRLDQC